jgi:molybdopterin molybdotransferase
MHADRSVEAAVSKHAAMPFGHALEKLLASVRPLPVENVPLEGAAGRVLGEALVARVPSPPFDQSAMDGYALRVAGLAGGGPWELPVVGESAAGAGEFALAPGAACRIFTGARLPLGADAVVPQENVERRGDVVVLAAAPPVGDCVRCRGEDLEAGVEALGAGCRLDPGRVALAAALDRTHVLVGRRPVITVVCTGNELRPPGSSPESGGIPESNGCFVAAAARAAGAVVRRTALVRDDGPAAERALKDALRGADVVVTIGGVSVGDHDVVRPALAAAGVTLDVWRVAMKPGKPLALGRAGDAHVLALPGNPVAAGLTFVLFGVPLLRALQGDRAPVPARFVAAVEGGLRRHPGREEFVRARLVVRGGTLVAVMAPRQGSGSVSSLAKADALVVVPKDHGDVVDGERLEVLRIADAWT